MRGTIETLKRDSIELGLHCPHCDRPFLEGDRRVIINYVKDGRTIEGAGLHRICFQAIGGI
jgi:hypothetical protein